MVDALHSSQSEIRLTENAPGESIFKFYSIANEVAFLKKTRGIGPEEQQFYLKKNVERFLGEFAGKVPYTKISYRLKDGELYFADIPTMRVYKETAEMTPEGSRERAEYEGMDKIRQGLNHVAVQSAFMISPSKIADYGLGFYFKKNGDVVDEYILRYREDLGKTDMSARMYEAVTGQSTALARANDFVRNPVFFGSDVLTNILGSPDLKIDKAKIEKSQQFEHMVEEEMGYWIDQYAKHVQELSVLDVRSERYKEKEAEARIVFAALFNMARDIKDSLDGAETSDSTYYRRHHQGDVEVIRYFYTLEVKPVVSGGSCPVTTENNGENGFLSSHAIHSILKNGRRVEDTLSFDCPKCGKPIPAGQGVEVCPHCHYTKEQAKKDNGVSCD